MGLFFNNEDEKNSKNNYLDDQKSLFDTEGEENAKKIDNSYDQYVFKKKEYSDIPKYKASTSRKVQVVVNKDDFGYQDMNPDIATIDLEKKNLHSDLNEIVNNGPIDESTKDISTSIYDEKLSKTITKEQPIEIIEVDYDNEVVIADVVEQDIDKSKKLSIFGNSDEPIQAKVYEVKEAPKKEKIEIIDVNISEEKVEEEPEVKLNEDGNKVCPQCGAPLAPDAEVCFLCGNKF